MIPVYRPCLGAEELRAVAEVFDSRWLGMGPVVRRFEERLAAFLGAEHVVATSHGTSALHLALDALGLGPGDEVVVPSLTFVATVQAIRMTGAVPVFCEVLPDTLNLDPGDALGRLTARTRAILPVHFGGLPCEIDALRREAARRGIAIVEDAAHLFGCGGDGTRGEPPGAISCYSFDTIKNITCGEGGAVVTSDGALAERMRARRRLGMRAPEPGSAAADGSWQYEVASHGFRYHMSDVNAAIGLAQLEKLPRFLSRRRQIAARYDEAFSGVEGMEILHRDLERTCPWAYVVKIVGGRRDSFRSHLREAGVDTLVQFIPNHLQPAFAPWRTALPVTERLFEQIVSLPFHLELNDGGVQTVVDAVRGFFRPDSGTPGAGQRPA